MSVGGLFDRLSALSAGLGIGSAAATMDNEPMYHVSTGRWSRFLGLTAAGAGARAASGAWTWNWHEMKEFRTRLYWIFAVVILLLIAAITNPREYSFREHLTELSFRRHLAYFRSPDDSTLPEDETAPEPNGHVAEVVAPVAPFRFASHVSVSLRTPPMHYRTLCFFSLALTAPLAPPIFLPDLAPTPTGRKCPWPREQVVLYIGYFGYWVRLGMFPRRLEWVWRLFTDGPKDKGKRKSLLEKPGVMGMRAISTKEETPIGSKRDSMLSPSKLLRKSDSAANLSDSPLPLHAPVPAYVNESRRSSIVNLVPTSPQPEIEANSPLLLALKGELTAAQTALSELSTQLLSHEESVSRAHSHLQSTLDEHRTRRKEDDAERQELKSRTKNLDEQKRQAEGARREAEKKLRAAKASRDGLEGKIAAAMSEIKRLSGSVDSSRKNVQTVQEEGARWVIETRDVVEGRRKEMGTLEVDLEHLDEGNAHLLEAIKEAEGRVAEVLKASEEAKKLGPEEEMMMMAAAYEAAAQEGYHDPRGQPHRDQWANQAAQYMAEAGMPSLDHNYTARPSQSTTFGHLAQSRQGSGDEAVGTRSPADLTGFENFGPGTKARRPATPPRSDSGSDVWGDPGSPNGGISTTFSANLLPQGLFRSLEGDQTPLRERIEDIPSPLTKRSPLVGSPTNGHAKFDKDDSSDSSSEHDLWRSPIPAPAGLLDGTGRLLAPSTTPPSAPAIPGLPSLPTVRPWLSTSSSENLAYTTSNDSLLIRTTSGPYEANPFAPSASEKKALALNWGPLSRAKWGRPDGGQPSGPTRNLSLNTNWLSSRLPNSHHPLKTSISNDAIRPPTQTPVQSEEDPGNPGESPKKPFRFFSLRRPTSSGQGSNSSKEGQLSTSQGSNAS